ncbi:uncharacterized protein ACNS7B_004967 [Menidia menidia]
MKTCKKTHVAMDRNRRRLASQLCAAVNDGDPRSVQMLLSEGASPDLVGSKGVAAIHLAVGKETEKNLRCLKMLLQRGADPNIRSSDGLTPLHVAALWGCYQNLKLLLMNGGNPANIDNEGNTPRQLAEQQENLKCARLLEEYQASSPHTKEDDIPQFQYSVLADRTDTSSYPESDYSFSSQSSMISDFGEAPLSSTRRSSFFNLSNVNKRPMCRGVSFGPSFLSSTRMSEVGPAVLALKDDAFRPDEGPFSTNGDETDTMPPRSRNTVPAFSSRKTITFRDIDEYFPVFSPDSDRRPAGEGSSSLPFDVSEYSDFLSSERMATVLPKQGIDVTSPDHVYVFCRESSERPGEEMEKTVVGQYALEVSDDEPEELNPRGPQVDASERGAHPRAGSGSSGTSSSHYSSCESDHYTSALDVSRNPGYPLPPMAEDMSSGAESDKISRDSTDSDDRFTRQDENLPLVRPEPEARSKPEPGGTLPDIDKLSLTEERQPKSPASEGGTDACEGDVATPLVDFRSDAVEEDDALVFSPFVTGRTRSRLSRCSLRTSKTPDSLLVSSLFEDTLPTPVRTLRQTPRSQRSGLSHNSPQPACCTPSHSNTSKERESFSVDSQSMETNSTVSSSQADTFILPKTVADSADESRSLSDTVILERKPDDSVDASERNLAEIIRAMRKENMGLCDVREFLTDDLMSGDEASAKGNDSDPPVTEQTGSQSSEEAWITEDCGRQSDSTSSSSKSSCFSPRRSREDSDFPGAPVRGCTPRYSMSRLSSVHRPQRLADLSYTPGGRPHIQDPDEPVEYLYTDTEQGHKLIETHVPPTSDTSLSSSISEETVLYDWRSLQSETTGSEGKENQSPRTAARQEESGDSADGAPPDMRGMTDKELRRRLLEFGESPGPISRCTRPTYMRRLRRHLQETEPRSQSPQKQLEPPQTGYSPELSRVLQTLKLPDCHADEQALSQQFDQPDQNRKWREGIIKSSFNYLLLDPRVTKNLPFRSHTMAPHECFQTFIHAIFYVGKGKRSRPYSHLYEALEYFRGDKTSKKLCQKVQHILQVWGAGQGVISLHCFQNVIPVEAYTREACMVEAMGLKMLTNKKRGDFYGVASNWELKRKRDLGVHLLYRAMQIFLAEGERQLRPADIRQ